MQSKYHFGPTFVEYVEIDERLKRMREFIGASEPRAAAACGGLSFAPNESKQS
jgi:hypothetical protein